MALISNDFEGVENFDFGVRYYFILSGIFKYDEAHMKYYIFTTIIENEDFQIE